MTAWIITVGREFEEHLGFAVEDGLWDTRVRRDIRSGNEAYFWLSGVGFQSMVRVTADLRQLRAGDQQARWHNRDSGGYQYRFLLDEVSSAPQRDVAWGTMAQATGITQPASNGILEIPIEAEGYFRSLFGQDVAAANAETSRADFQFDPEVYEPGEDTRERAVRAINLRRGQSAFRDSLVDAYDSTCAVTGSTVLSILEAAHIDRYFGDQSHHVGNGLLLRCDIHTLFDLQRIAIVDFTVKVAPALSESEYARFDGAPLRLPAEGDARPDAAALQRHAEGCKWLNSPRAPESRNF